MSSKCFCALYFCGQCRVKIANRFYFAYFYLPSFLFRYARMDLFIFVCSTFLLHFNVGLNICCNKTRMLRACCPLVLGVVCPNWWKAVLFCPLPVETEHSPLPEHTCLCCWESEGKAEQTQNMVWQLTWSSNNAIWRTLNNEFDDIHTLSVKFH